MHPWDHARSSANTHGGDPTDYIKVHSWFDATKIAAVKPGHRLFRHHKEGIDEASSLFGATMSNSAGQEVMTRDLGRQHLVEDCSTVPAAADWLQHLPLEYITDRLTEVKVSELPEFLPVKMSSKFGGSTADYNPIHEWFLETCSWFEDIRHLAMRHNSFGVFAAEERFGVVFARSDGVKVPTRLIAEHHIRTIFRTVPSASEIINKLTLQRWMNAATSPSKMGLT